MFLSDLSVTRPVFAAVLGILLVVFGIVSFTQLPLRQYPDIDPPVVTIETAYPGAAASIVESRITEIIEDRISGIEGIDFIQSSSEDGESNVTIQFKTGRDVDSAANDVRDRVSRIVDNLPDEADPPEVQKRDADESVIVWLSLSSPNMSTLELTDFAERYVADRFSVLPGVALVVGGVPDGMRAGVAVGAASALLVAVFAFQLNASMLAPALATMESDLNATTAQIGMTQTTFVNPHGWTTQGHLSTARDMTVLGRRLFFDFPQYYNIFSRRMAVYRALIGDTSAGGLAASIRL